MGAFLSRSRERRNMLQRRSRLLWLAIVVQIFIAAWIVRGFLGAVTVGRMEIDFEEGFRQRLGSALVAFAIPMLLGTVSVFGLYFRANYGRWFSLALDSVIGMLSLYAISSQVNSLAQSSSQLGRHIIMEDILVNTVVLFLSILGVVLMSISFRKKSASSDAFK